MSPWAKTHLNICIMAIMMFLALPTAVLAQTVRVGGTGFGLGVVKLLAEAFEKSHAGIKIQVAPSLGSTGGIKALLDGSLDIALSGRPPTEAETGKGAAGTEVARSPFVFMVNNNVGKEAITTAELASIYSGQTSSWPNGTRIRLVLRPETDTTTKTVRGMSPQMDQAMTLAMAREGMIRAVTDQENVDTVVKTPGSLAVGTLTQLYAEKRPVKVLALNGVKPSAGGVGNGSYPLSVPLYLLTSTRTSAAARQFVDFIHSGDGGKILAKYGNIVGKERRAK
jgi:phosphate transport system substrate-binding protein